MSTYLVCFEVIHDRYDKGDKFIKAISKKIAIKIFRKEYPKGEYRITEIYKQISP